MANTEDYIKRHIAKVQDRMKTITSLLDERAKKHDESKLQEPELSGWKQMDQEPRYIYGTAEYKDKMERYSWLFKLHYGRNSHHPEFYDNDLSQMDLLDLIEMVCDWTSYDDMDKNHAYSTFEKQVERFKFPEYLNSILENTATRYLVKDRTISSSKPISSIITIFEDEDRAKHERSKKVQEYIDSVKELLAQDGIIEKEVPILPEEPPKDKELLSKSTDILFSTDAIDLKALKKFER